jgi:hypothetical protein
MARNNMTNKNLTDSTDSIDYNKLLDMSKSKKLMVCIDYNDYISKDKPNEFIELLKSEFGDVDHKYYLRYSIAPDPIIIFEWSRDLFTNVNWNDLLYIGGGIMYEKLRTRIKDKIEDKIFDEILKIVNDNIKKVLNCLTKSNIIKDLKHTSKLMTLSFKFDMGTTVEILLKIHPSNFGSIATFINGEIIGEIITDSYRFNDFDNLHLKYVITENEWYLSNINQDNNIIYSKKGYEHLIKELESARTE